MNIYIKILIVVIVSSVISLTGSIIYIYFYIDSNYRTITSYIHTFELATVDRIQSLESIPANLTRSNLNLPIPNSDWNRLQTEIPNILGNEQNKYAVYIESLQTGQTYGWKSQEIFPPASIYKVPLAMLVLLEVDNGNLTLDTNWTVLERDKVYSFDQLSKISGNYQMSVAKLLEYLIVYSDNTAMTTIERELGGYNNVQSLIESELGFTEISRRPHETTAKGVGKVFHNIYFGKSLSNESRDLLLELLNNVFEPHRDRLEAGISKEDTRIAHKIGTLIGTYQDAGIIFTPEYDMIIVVLNKDITSDQVARTKTSAIASLIEEIAY